MFIAIDFDGTIVEHRYPDLGAPVKDAIHWMHKWKEAGADLILYTMRHDSEKDGPVLTDAVEYCRKHGIEFYGVNENPSQHWSLSRKVYAHIYVDDAAMGCPLKIPANGDRAYVDWSIVGPSVLARIEASNR